MRVAEVTNTLCNLCAEGRARYLGQPEVPSRRTRLLRLSTYSDTGEHLADVLYCHLCDPNVGIRGSAEHAE